MKKHCVFLTFLLLVGIQVTAYGEKRDGVIYTGVVNKVPDGFNFPLIGLFNLAEGSHTSVHIGLGNTNEDDLAGGQIGLININGGKMDGSQVGLINTTVDGVQGLQLGLVNTAGDGVIGTQIGLVNATEEVDGVQVGLVNASETLNGVQVSLVNATEELNGVQVGLVNASETLNGIRLGLVNATENLNGVELGLLNMVENLNGFQMGLVNVVESVDGGVPFGLISFVKEGGYRSFDISTTEMFPVNLSYKIGVKPLYTSFVVSYDRHLPHKLATGIGIGSILPLSESLYLNPELLSQNKLVSENTFLYSLGLNVGYCLSEKLHLSLGPSLVWNHARNTNDLFHENVAIRKWAIDDHTNLFLGVRIGIRYVFTDFDN